MRVAATLVLLVGQQLAGEASAQTPPPSPSPPPPAPLAPGTLLYQTSGPSECTVDSQGCASAGYPVTGSTYSTSTSCAWSVLAPAQITTTYFKTESYFDYVRITAGSSSSYYSGSTGPTGALAAGDVIYWCAARAILMHAAALTIQRIVLSGTPTIPTPCPPAASPSAQPRPPQARLQYPPRLHRLQWARPLTS